MRMRLPLSAVMLCTLAFAPAASALDADPWDRVLQAHARAGGVDYAALAADPAARGDLRRFVASVAVMTEDEPLSAWLNAYNALVVSAVVERYPIRSVRDAPGFFDRVRHRVAGRSRTLDSIEHEVIRPRFADARVHVALNCGARSCPALHGRAFREPTLDATLDRLARAVVADPRHVRVDAGRVSASEIFRWFEADFARDAGSVLAWLRRYDDGRLASVAPDAAVSALPYDWAINDRPGANAAARPCSRARR